MMFLSVIFQWSRKCSFIWSTGSTAWLAQEFAVFVRYASWFENYILCLFSDNCSLLHVIFCSCYKFTLTVSLKLCMLFYMFKRDGLSSWELDNKLHWCVGRKWVRDIGYYLVWYIRYPFPSFPWIEISILCINDGKIWREISWVQIKMGKLRWHISL